jgi:hypothetical protein
VQGQADLLQIVHALGTVGGLAHFLDGGQQQAHQNCNNGDHNQQFDQRKRLAVGLHDLLPVEGR